jgi:Tol biopolymer transport system component
MNAQFYNGSQQEYGKNTLQFDKKFSWKSQDFQGYQIYFYAEEEKLVDYVSQKIQAEIENLETQFDFIFSQELEFVLFKSFSDMRQSNIGSSREEVETIGKNSLLVGSKSLIYYQSSHAELDIQIKKMLAENMLNQMLYGEKWSDVLLANPLSNHPAWFINGFISFYGQPWNAALDSKMKDAFLTGRLDDFSILTDEDAILAGHAFWNYIQLMYGNDKLFQVVKMTEIAQHVDRSLRYVIGQNSQEILPEFGNYYKKIYLNDLTSQSDISFEKLKFNLPKNHIYKNFAPSPDGNKMALVDFYEGKTTIWLYDLTTFDKTKIYQFGVKLNRLQDYALPLLAWNPSGKLLSFFHETKGYLNFAFYDLENKELNSKKMAQLDKVQAFDFAADGTKLILSGVKNGQTDLYLLTIAGNALEQITNDIWDEHDPSFGLNDEMIIFTSNRLNDTIFENIVNKKYENQLFDVFTLSLKKSKKVKNKLLVCNRITNTPFENETKPKLLEKNLYSFLSDKSGTMNIFLAHEDSMILFVDSLIHYQYQTIAKPIYQFSTSIVDYQISDKNQQLFFQVFQNSRFKSYQTAFSREVVGEVSISFFRKKELTLLESAWKKQQLLNEKLKDSLKIESTKPQVNLYETNFSKELVLIQVNNGFLNAAYQRFGGAGSKFNNSPLSILFQSTMTDFFEDFKIRGAMRIPTNFNAGEFLGILDVNKFKLDHEISIYRQSYSSINQNDYITKWTVNELKYKLILPITETFSWRNSIGYRNDKQVFLATDKSTLEMPKIRFNQLSLKTELILDNATFLELNTWKGWRAKVFGEAALIANKNEKWVFNFGLDIRNSKSFYKGITWVNRLAGAGSVGSAPIVYYLGGVDNWTIRPNISFDNNQALNTNQNYFFQTIATPLRGFIQNARNGNSFFVFNSEWRIPVFKVLSNHAVKNEFLRTFQWILFADAGCSWTGLTPFSSNNHFNTLSINSKPLEIQLFNSREPIVGGIGSGVRTKVFGYFIRFDLGWGIEDFQINKKPIGYFSIGYDI